MTKTIKQALALKNGEFQDGIYLCLSDDLMIDQTSWDDSDLAKGIDFNIYPYWVIGNDVTPQGILDDEDFKSFQEVIAYEQIDDEDCRFFESEFDLK